MLQTEHKGSCRFRLMASLPHRVRPRIDLASDQVLKIDLSLTKKKRQHCAHDKTKPHRTFLFLIV